MEAHIPTNAELREKAIQSVALTNEKGQKGDCLNAILEEFLRLQYLYFPLFCYETMKVNYERQKELEKYGNKTSTKMVGGKVYEGTTGWSEDKTLKESWIIPEQLHSFMMHINPSFWLDSNAPTRNGFMKAVLRGDEPYGLLRKVYAEYGSNLQNSSKEIILN